MVQCLPPSCSSLYCILEPCFDYSRASNYFSGFFYCSHVGALSRHESFLLCTTTCPDTLIVLLCSVQPKLGMFHPVY